MKYTIAPESANACVVVKLPNLQGNVNLLGSRIFVGNLFKIVVEHCSLRMKLDASSNFFEFVSRYFRNYLYFRI